MKEQKHTDWTSKFLWASSVLVSAWIVYDYVDEFYLLKYNDIQVYHLFAIWFIAKFLRMSVRFAALKLGRHALKSGYSIDIITILNAIARTSFEEHTLFNKDGKTKSFLEVEEDMANARIQNRDVAIADTEVKAEYGEPESQKIEDSIGILDLQPGEIMIQSSHITDKVAHSLRRDSEITHMMKKGLLITSSAESIFMNNNRSDIIEHYSDWELLTGGLYSYTKDSDEDGLISRYEEYVRNLLVPHKELLSKHIITFLKDKHSVAILQEYINKEVNSPLLLKVEDANLEELDGVNGVKAYRGAIIVITAGRYGCLVNTHGDLVSIVKLPETLVQTGRTHP